ncbi:MAG: Sigma54 specific transcriptional regulator [Clostridiales bacterium 38_11]|nr:MAG: Sigma54 specific transcriptional regulator [Clostridiales bacterium 38_11]HBH12928.1 hypothetical protein [Clostridiales bacterium]
MDKKTVCYISRSEVTARHIEAQLVEFLGDYINVHVWILEHEEILPYPTCDIYIAGSKTVFGIVEHQLPSKSLIITASRALGINNLDRLFQIPQGSKVIVVGYWEEVALTTINLLKEYGFDYFKMIPYFLNCGVEIPTDIDTAISPGVNYVVPNSIKNIVDIGARGLELSTFVELVEYLNLPREIINGISHNYVEEILNLGLKHYKTACKNEELKKNIEVILNTVDEAIVSVDKDNKIVVFNHVAEDLLGVNYIQVTNRDVREILPQVDFSYCLQTGESIVNEIRYINGNYFVLSTNPILDEDNEISGIVSIFRPVREVKELEAKVRRELKSKGNLANYTFGHIVGESTEVLKAVNMAKKFAKTKLAILLEGESGTGKEIFAQAIHNYSEQNSNPFVAINFAALPDSLVESELFGYEGGAFTGAKKEGKAGLFEEAHMGTIFLDEIGDASLEVQKSLLRVLEEHKVRRVGGNTLTPVDVRVIAATNQNLDSLMKSGKFRGDLFYRLCTLPIKIPELKSRGNDILILTDYFSHKLYNRNLILENPLKDFFLSYSWPGNIRELENVVKYLCSMVEADDTVTIRHLPLYMMRSEEKPPEVNNEISKTQSEYIKFDEVMQNFKKQEILRPIIMILTEIHNAGVLNNGIGRQTLMKKLKDSDIGFADHKIKKWLKNLAELGYVDIGKTKQGSRISQKGEEFLNYASKKLL